MATENPTPNGSTSTSCPSLDIERVHALPSEQQDLYLLTFSSDLNRHVAALDADGAKDQQASVKQEVLKIVNLSSPTPSRVIRNNIGACIAGIFSKGDRKLLFETVNDLQAIINLQGKAEKDIKIKHTAVHCLGTIFEAAGDSAIASSTLACSSILKLLKVAQNNVGFRGTLFVALGRIIRGIGNSADEGAVRDVLKQARNSAAGDNAFFVQASACWCLEQLHVCTHFLDNSADYDKLCSSLWRAMDSTSVAVRKAAAACLAIVLVKSHSTTAGPAVRPKKPKKIKTKVADQDDADGEIERPGSPAPQKPVTKLSFTLLEILRQLSNQYCRGVSNRVRAAIASCYNRVLKGLDQSIVQAQYGVIARHFFEDLLSSSSIIHHRYRLLMTRKVARINLGDLICRRILTESSQHDAIKFLVNGIVKDYPQSEVKERPEPSKEALIGAVDALHPLIESLGRATYSDADLCRDGLLQALQHPSHSVQVHTSRCLRSLVRACPQQLLPIATMTLNTVNREISQLTSPRKSPRKCLGLAQGLAAVISAANEEPLYGSLDVYSNIFSQASNILKTSSGSDLRLSSTQIQVAWIMITSLTTLGPDFVKGHLSQLFLLWKNALPPPLSRENAGHRGLLELSFLAHVRECALTSISSFLHFNSRLLTLDVSKRLAIMLQNTTSFLNTLPNRKTSDSPDALLNPSLQLLDYDLMLRRRIFQCYSELFRSGPESNQDTMLQSNILSMVITSFSEPDLAASGGLRAAIAASTSTYDNIWDVGDSSTFGLTGLVQRSEVKLLFLDQDGRIRPALDLSRSHETSEQLFRNPVASDLEHDPVQIMRSKSNDLPDPLTTSVVNYAIRLFAQTLLHQSSSIQQGALEQISIYLAGTSGQQNAAKEQAITLNIVIALLLALHTAHASRAPSTMVSANVQKAFQEILNGAILHPDLTIRSLASEAMGRLCRISGIEFATQEITYLIDMIVSNREPHARSGCAAALGCLHAQLGGMAAGIHLKNIIGILTSLANDPHPTVHSSAIDALSRVADSAGLAFSGYVSSTLGLLAQLYVLDSHNEESASVNSSNIDLDTPTCAFVARAVDSMINALGPDLQDMTKTRNLLLTLTYQYQLEKASSVSVESLRCLEHMSMYAPGHISFQPYVRQLQGRLFDDDEEVHDVALAGILSVMRKGAEEVIGVTGSSLEKQLWLTMHEMYGSGMIRKIIRDWVEQSGLTHLARWIARIQTVLTTSLHTSQAEPPKQMTQRQGAEDEEDGEPPVQDEEVAGFNAASRAEKENPDAAPNLSPELLRWQARYEAMSCLNFILSAVAKEVEAKEDTLVLELLQPRVADVVRIAFSASTASVVDIRIEGIRVIGKMLEIFGRVPDPDFSDATLLEQYQAQISSALTPAFASDSSPVLAAEAVNVCAVFISTGIVTDAERMGRILRVFVSALDDFSQNDETAAIGDLKNLSSSALVMVKLSVFSAWASLQVASHEQHYLKDILKPHLAKLTPLWLSSLREYARLKFEPEVSSNNAFSGGLDMVHSTLTRKTIMKFYEASWLQVVEAIASLIDEDSEFVFDALDGKENSDKTNGASSKGQEISYRDEPVAFFFVLFGISFEALVRSASHATGSRQRMLEILQAMKKIVSPSVAGMAIYQDHIFSEFMDLMDRLALTEGIEVQIVIVEIARNLGAGHPSARTDHTNGEDHLSDDIDQLFELTRIIVLVISSHVPNLSAHQVARNELPEPAVALVVLALEALVDVAAVFPVIIRSDLHACILHIFSNVISSATCQASLVPTALPIFRRFLTGLVQDQQHDTYSQLRSAVARLLTILKTAKRRENAASLPCEKNTLLATTILFMSCSSIFAANDPLLTLFEDELVDCLGNKMTTKVAAGLSRSLLLLPFQQRKDGSSTRASAVLSSRILPRLVEFLVNPSEIEDTDQARPVIASALTSFAISAPLPQQRATTCGLVTSALLRRAGIEGKVVWKETSSKLIEIGGALQSVFRGVIAQLSAEQRQLLEEVIKTGAGSGKAYSRAQEAELKEPSIALKLDF